eukprot:CAMPEP_0179023790 /NCGR_PEP_ID=MMETSP0796-20121207/7113_1 /TAXON_ID=73915 /ORGANISM="Pyrodinium bahamense, Strain pbaha01" /LENGTH=664 /DNA_ID=CAMNT_0020719715 /DNA_START=13 /DNA_END=2003 /DNA_ORIENTATION=-
MSLASKQVYVYVREDGRQLKPGTRITRDALAPEHTPKSRLSSDFDARRLENAVWRHWRMHRSNSASSDKELACTSDSGTGDCRDEEEETLVKKLEVTIGKRVEFATIRFPQTNRTCNYDDLPTFPVRPDFSGFENALGPASECVVFDGCPDDPYHPSNTPIYQTATFVQPSASEFGAYDYTRSGNPTRTALEKHVAMLEQAAAAFAFASGMAALHTVMRLLRSGDEILCNEDIYGGMHRLLTQDCVHNGVKVTFVDTTDLESVARAISPHTKLIHTESPSNPRMRITDLRALAKLAHNHGVLLSVDSTMMPPVICKPLTLGVDITVHSATKFFSGHADCTGGLVCVRDPSLAHRVAFLQNAEGTALAPFECFLFLRGIKTMHLRVQRAQENAEKIGEFLLQHPRVKQVFFPGRGGCSARSLRVHRSQCHGQGSMVSLTTGSVDFSRRFLEACRIFKMTVSFGSVNSLCEMPCTMSHASIPAEKRTLPDDLVRLSIGIEDVRDLIADLRQALDVAASGNKELGGVFDSVFEELPPLPKIPSPGSLTAASTAVAPSPSTKSPRSSEAGPSAEASPLPRPLAPKRGAGDGSGSPLQELTPLRCSASDTALGRADRGLGSARPGGPACWCRAGGHTPLPEHMATGPLSAQCCATPATWPLRRSSCVKA